MSIDGNGKLNIQSGGLRVLTGGATVESGQLVVDSGMTIVSGGLRLQYYNLTNVDSGTFVYNTATNELTMDVNASSPDYQADIMFVAGWLAG